MIGFRFIPRFFSLTGFSDVQSALTITSPASGDVIYQTIPTTISGTIARGTEFTAARLLVNGVPYNTISAFTITATEWSCPFTPVDAGITSLTVQFTHPNGFTFTAQTISRAVSAASGLLPTSYTGLISWHAPTGATIETAYMNQAPSAFATQNNVTHASGIADPDGGTAAYRMTDNSTNAVHDVINTLGNWLGVTKQQGEAEYRAIVTRAPASTLNFVIGQSESQGVNINLGTGALTNVGINAVFKSQAAYATSWFDFRTVVSSATQTCLLLSNGSTGAGYVGTGKSVDMFCPTYWGQQRQITNVVDYSGNTYNLNPASAALRFIAVDDLAGGKLFGSLTAGITKTAPLNSATQTALAGSFTVVMRVYVNSTAGGTVNWLAITGSGSRTMVIRRNGADLELFRYNNAAESGTATLATITTGFHTIAVTFNATTGQATCYYDKSAGTTNTAISGVLTPTAGILTTNGYSISEMAIYSEVRSKADCDALADGMTARKGNI